ncbi:DUF4215 domain-containing protein, partial [Endomicrobium sp. AH-315-J14]|nr:DUF4215 domain-containing protein [Endomicrobium sp. AH-315-J14]
TAGVVLQAVDVKMTVDLELGEQCDDGNDVDDDECLPSCVRASCGDNIIQAVIGETCDEGDVAPFDDCTFDCKAPELSITDAKASKENGEVLFAVKGFAPETLVDTLLVDYLDGISPIPLLSVELAPDDLLEAGSPTPLIEVLDDQVSGQIELDGVAKVRLRLRDVAFRIGAQKTIELVEGDCGNGVTQGAEQCDDKNQDDTDGCTNSCRLPVIDLRNLVVTRNNLDDLAIFYQGYIEGGSLELLDVEFYDGKNVMPVASTFFEVDANAMDEQGQFALLHNEVEFFATGAQKQAVSVRVRLKNSNNKPSDYLAAMIQDIVCGDNKIVPLFETCDEGLDPSESCDRCQQISQGGAGGCGLFQCALEPNRNESGPLWLLLPALFLLRRRRIRVRATRDVHASQAPTF